MPAGLGWQRRSPPLPASCDRSSSITWQRKRPPQLRGGSYSRRRFREPCRRTRLRRSCSSMPMCCDHTPRDRRQPQHRAAGFRRWAKEERQTDGEKKPSVQYRGGGRLRLCSASRSLRYSIPAGREGNRLLILGAMDPRDSRSPDASRRLSPTRVARPRPRISAARLMVNAKAGAAISGSAGDRHHLARQFHGRSSAR